MKRLLAVTLLAVCAAAPVLAQDGRPLPARFEADRVFLDETTADGQPIVFFTDSGGGASGIVHHPARRRHSSTRSALLSSRAVSPRPAP